MTKLKKEHPGPVSTREIGFVVARACRASYGVEGIARVLGDLHPDVDDSLPRATGYAIGGLVSAMEELARLSQDQCEEVMQWLAVDRDGHPEAQATEELGEIVGVVRMPPRRQGGAGD